MEQTLGQFLNAELHRRDMTARELSRQSEINHQTINNLLNDDYGNYPTLGTLVGVARVLGIDICTLVSLAAPDVVVERSAANRALAEMIASQPEYIQEAILAMLRGTKTNASDQKE